MNHHAILLTGSLVVAISALMLTACGGPNANDRAVGDSITTGLVENTDIQQVELVPGIGAGTYKLGDADSLVLQQLGQPDHSDAAMGKAVLIWYTDSAERHPLSIFTARDMGNDETARIQQIRVTSPVFRTADSIQVGSSLAEIRRAYQLVAVESYEVAGDAYTVYAAEEGIAFEIGPDDRCVAIIIQPAGGRMASYLPLRPVN